MSVFHTRIGYWKDGGDKLFKHVRFNECYSNCGINIVDIFAESDDE